MNNMVICEVCDSTVNLQVHHWAPRHIFGKQCEKWPTSVLCAKCHKTWHLEVTPLIRDIIIRKETDRQVKRLKDFKRETSI